MTSRPYRVNVATVEVGDVIRVETSSEGVERSAKGEVVAINHTAGARHLVGRDGRNLASFGLANTGAVVCYMHKRKELHTPLFELGDVS